jgi:hypothetical protein
MSGLLDSMSEDFTRRIAIRRRMMAHLGLFPTDRDCTTLRPELRETLIACARCPNPDVCDGWIDQNRPGTPVFCRARETFLRLEAALEPPAEIRLRA